MFTEKMIHKKTVKQLPLRHRHKHTQIFVQDCRYPSPILLYFDKQACKRLQTITQILLIALN